MKSSNKSRLLALLLCFCLGTLGMHRFYVGKTGSAVVQLLTLGGLGLWAFWDLITIFLGTFEDKNNLVLEDW